MAIKWKGWTGRLPVKIVCLILVPVLAFLSLYIVIGLTEINVDNLRDDILFADIDKNDYYYDTYMNEVLSNAHTLFGLQSEEHIRNMGCLKWEPAEWGTDEYGRRVKGYYLVSSAAAYWGGRCSYDSVYSDELDSLEAGQMVANAINSQLSEYFYAKKSLEEMPGLYYLVTDGERTLANTSPDAVDDFFRSQPVYYIEKFGEKPVSSRYTDDSYKYYSYGYYGQPEVSISIAFDNDVVAAQNALWKDTQQEIGRDVAIIGFAVLLVLFLMIILMVGAGRRYGREGIHFVVSDKLWLDFGLCLLVVYEVAISAGYYYLANLAWRHGNFAWVTLLSAVLSACFMLPLLWWLMSFTKYCKVGKWWRHTMVYAVLHGLYSRVRKFLKSLWAGFPLTAKVVAICGALLAVTLFCTLTIPNWFALILSIVVTALTVFGLLRHARKLFLVEQGAKAANVGLLNTPIAVAGGELGSIAASINNISDGISATVSERMKSERLKTELITNVSHDIRTPLTSLITYTELLKNEGLDNEKAPEYLDILIQKSARLKTLTDDLFEASKAASGNIDVQLGELDLSDFVTQVLGELDERVSASGLDFRLNMPEHAPVRADGRLLWRVMQNLLSNVFHYAQKGSRVYIDVVPENGEMRLDIKNISEVALNVDPGELTERFKRGDRARTGDGGSGLGLSIVQSFVQLQGGRFIIAIDGDLFKATVFLPK